MQTFSPIQYLKIDIASNFGLDKENWDTRIDWVDTNEANLESLVDEADEPALFYAGVKAYRAAQNGQPIAYPISLDATSSGAQLLSILIGCRKSASLCNVVDTGKREDLYTNQYLNMCKRIQDTSKIARDDIKKAIMTALYGSTAQPKRVFGEGTDLLQAFYATMEEETPGIWQLNKGLLDLWQPTTLSHDWILPDNFHVKTKVMVDEVHNFNFMNQPHEVTKKVNKPSPDGLSIGANVIHSIDGMVVREMLRRCCYNVTTLTHVMTLLTKTSVGKSLITEDDQMVQTLWKHYQETGFLSARILDHLRVENMGHVDPKVIEELVLSMPEQPFPILAIHDCFRVHPNYGNDLRRQYNRILHELAKSDILVSIASQIVGHQVSVQKYDDIANDVLVANYALS